MTDTAQVAIVNQTLFLLGQEPVSDLNEASLQQSLAATKLMRVIDAARDVTLRRHGWTCALEYATLPPAVIGGYANWRYPSVFQLPGDAVRVWEIEGQCLGGSSWVDELGWHGAAAFDGLGGVRWQVGSFETGGGGSRLIIRTNSQSSLNVCYVRRASWGALDANVRDMLAYDLAARGAHSVTGNLALSQGLMKQAEEKALMAVSVDGTQEGGQPPVGYSQTAQIRNMSR